MKMKPLIICVAGKKQVGKNTTGDLISKYLQWNYGRIESFGFSEEEEAYWDKGFNYQKFCPSPVFGSFAEALKEHCIALGLVSTDQCYGDDNDKNSLSNCWKGDRQLTAREVLQEVGQFHRELNPNCWIAALEKTYHDSILRPVLYIITDGRYPNELEWVQDNGGKVIYLKSDADTGNHPSEKSLSLEKHWDLIDLIVPGKDLATAKERENIILPVLDGWFKEYGLIGETK